MMRDVVLLIVLYYLPIIVAAIVGFVLIGCLVERYRKDRLEHLRFVAELNEEKDGAIR